MRLIDLVGALFLLTDCAPNLRTEPAPDRDSARTFALAGKAGSCDLSRGHVIPFAPSEAVPGSCSAGEQSAISGMEACFRALPTCEAGFEQRWLRRVEDCISIARAVSDRCLGAFIGPPLARMVRDMPGQ
jgi:hypothetical protein